MWLLKSDERETECKNSILLVFHDINGYGHVARLVWAGVQVAVIFRQQVNVMEDEAREAILFESLQGPNVHQHRPVKLSTPWNGEYW